MPFRWRLPKINSFGSKYPLTLHHQKEMENAERFYLTFDEFFKMGAKAFFEAFGYKVTTEFVLFRLPKKIDVIVIEAEEKSPPDDFALFKWFPSHNLISY